MKVEDHEMLDSEIPDYVCCVVTESVWTWFLTIILSVLLFALATLRYCKRHLGSEKYVSKNQHLLARQLIEYGREALSILRVAPVPESEFLNYCGLRQKHSAVIDKLEFAKTLKFDDDRKIIYQMSRQTSPSLRNLQNISWIYGRIETDRNWIVTDGPQEKTVADFWTTVFEQKCPVVVMLSKTFEIVKMVCVQYWPNHPGSEQVYGDLIVTLVKEKSFAHYKIRQLEVRNQHVAREVFLFQYLDWPATAHPDTTSLLHFRRQVHEHLTGLDCDGPALIHCQSSKRRSGTFLAIEFALSGRERNGHIDILGSVRWLRCQNPALISSPEQYHFIYELVEDCVLCGDTRISCHAVSNGNGNADDQVMSEGQIESVRCEKEYSTLCSLPNRLTMGDCAAGHRADNRDKNRNVLIVPPDDWRPYLTTFQSNTNTDYINAVFVDGFKTEREFIATEWPFSHTAANFWSMIYDHDVAAIVVLNCPPSKLLVLKNFIDFWPQSSILQSARPSEDVLKQFGPVFTVESLSREDKLDGDLGIWQLKVCKKEIAPHKKPNTNSSAIIDDKLNNITSLSNLLLGKGAPSKVVKLIQIRKSWPQNQAVPDSPLPLLSVMQEVDSWLSYKKSNPRNKRGDTEERVAVVSCDGIARIGLYCTAAHSIEKANTLDHYDIFQSAKSVRRSRPQLLSCEEEYKYCYELVKTHVKMSTTTTTTTASQNDLIVVQ